MSVLRSRTIATGNQQLDRQINELLRDLSSALGQLVPLDRLEFAATYTEPLNVGYDHEPDMLIAGRVRQDASPETAVTGNARVPFVWNAIKQQLQIAQINGCTVGVKYRFNFLVVG